MNPYIKFFFRLAVTVLLIFFLFKKFDILNIFISLKKINPVTFLFASFLYIVSSFVSTLRWKIFLPHPELTIGRLFSLYLIGSFFSISMPGIIGGDFVKVFILKEKTGLKQVFSSVFMERYIGLTTLLVIGFLFFILFYSSLPKNPIIWSVPLAFFGFIGGTIFLIWIGRFRFLRDFRDYIFSFKKKQIFQAFIYSVFIQITVIFSVYILFQGSNLSVCFFELASFLPTIILITMLPVSISGIGLREWCFVLFFGNLSGPANAIAVSFLWFLSQVFASLIGSIEYLRFKKPLNIKKK